MRLLIKKISMKNLFICLLVALILLFMNYSIKNSIYSKKLKANPTLFCFILTKPSNFYTKAVNVHRTWAKKCDNHKFISVIPKTYLNLSEVLISNGTIEIAYPVPLLHPFGLQNENYKKLTDKIYSTIIALYKHYNYYDWYLKADDDTFIFVENLKEFILNKSLTTASKFGYNLKTWQSGGAGYLFNKKALNIFGENLSQNSKICPNKGVEDQEMSICSKILNISEPNSIDEAGRELFHPFNVTMHLYGPQPSWVFKHSQNKVKTGKECCSVKTISFHYMSMEQINKMNFLWEEFKHSNHDSSDFYVMLYKMFI